MSDDVAKIIAILLIIVGNILGVAAIAFVVSSVVKAVFSGC